ncbi:tryptophan RNA-binding attenuator protein-like protein [Actinidia rufa]|uniref:Tryptophan RNA-binding attenuator protein-like protein n=1 Tax=Actinidia rufa TaxID=165716 RepID=A0A7J0DTT3_9ERIC|nr:tryptophan RNA-binding attenuator protein-like protein [Actinidia rufa]
MAITISYSGPVLKPGSAPMENVYVPENEAGIWQWLFGKNATSVVLLNTSSIDGFVGIAAPSLARILPIDLAMFGGELLCQPDAFLCSINDVKVTNTVVDQRARNVVAGAEGFLRQKLSGQGVAFIVAGGSESDFLYSGFFSPLSSGFFSPPSLISRKILRLVKYLLWMFPALLPYQQRSMFKSNIMFP